jgi:hypothetical protein
MLRVAGSPTTGQIGAYDLIRMISRDGRPTGLELVDDFRAALVILDLAAPHRCELDRQPGCLRELVSAPTDKAARGLLHVFALPLVSGLAVFSEQAAGLLVADMVDPPNLVEDSQQPIADVALERRRSHVLAAAEDVLAGGTQPRRRLMLGLLDVVDVVDDIFRELLLAFHTSRRYRCTYDRATNQAGLSAKSGLSAKFCPVRPRPRPYRCGEPTCPGEVAVLHYRPLLALHPAGQSDVIMKAEHPDAIFQIIGAIGEFEHALMRERTMDGLAAARARGRTGGQKPKLSPRQIKRVQEA